MYVNGEYRAVKPYNELTQHERTHCTCGASIKCCKLEHEDERDEERRYSWECLHCGRHAGCALYSDMAWADMRASDPHWKREARVRQSAENFARREFLDVLRAIRPMLPTGALMTVGEMLLMRRVDRLLAKYGEDGQAAERVQDADRRIEALGIQTKWAEKRRLSS